MSKHSQDTTGQAERWRRKITQSNIMPHLLQYAEGKREMTAARAHVCLRLIGKILPDLQSVEVSATINHRGLNRLELETRLLMLGKDPKQVWDSLNGQNKIIEHEPDAQNNDIEKSV